MLKRTTEKLINVIEDKICEAVNKAIIEHLNAYHKPPNYKICETCGCVIGDGVAVKGEPIIKKRPISQYKDSWGYLESMWSVTYDPLATEDYIYTPYYCKVHAPKVKK